MNEQQVDRETFESQRHTENRTRMFQQLRNAEDYLRRRVADLTSERHQIEHAVALVRRHMTGDDAALNDVATRFVEAGELRQARLLARIKFTRDQLELTLAQIREMQDRTERDAPSTAVFDSEDVEQWQSRR